MQPYAQYRNRELNKWSKRLMLGAGESAAGKKATAFKALDKDFGEQVAAVMADETRLFGRTRVKRTRHALDAVAPPPGPDDAAAADDDAQDAPAGAKNVRRDPEIYDDSDLYQLLLRELIDSGAGEEGGDASNPVAMSRRALALKNLSAKAPRVFDRKGSKNKRIRYNVHDKLVNFMAPFQVDDEEGTDSIRDALFSRLFGKRIALTALNAPPQA